MRKSGHKGRVHELELLPEHEHETDRPLLICLPCTSFLSTHVVDGLKASPIVLVLLSPVTFEIHLNLKRLVMGLFSVMLLDTFVLTDKEQGSNDYWQSLPHRSAAYYALQGDPASHPRVHKYCQTGMCCPFRCGSSSRCDLLPMGISWKAGTLARRWVMRLQCLA